MFLDKVGIRNILLQDMEDGRKNSRMLYSHGFF